LVKPALTLAVVACVAAVVVFVATDVTDVVAVVAFTAACVVDCTPRFNCAKEKIETPVAITVVINFFIVYGFKVLKKVSLFTGNMFFNSCDQFQILWILWSLAGWLS